MQGTAGKWIGSVSKCDFLMSNMRPEHQGQRVVRFVCMNGLSIHHDLVGKFSTCKEAANIYDKIWFAICAGMRSDFNIAVFAPNETAYRSNI